jgi:hypothetical protein
MSPIEMKLHDALESLETRDDFVKFVELLVSSHKEPDAPWENSSIETFLSGLARAARELEASYDSSAAAQANVESPNWEAVAGMLFTARCMK